MKIHFPGESVAYPEARDHLLRRELELRRQMESVAAERRALPPAASFRATMVSMNAGQMELASRFGYRSSLPLEPPHLPSITSCSRAGRPISDQNPQSGAP